MDSTRWMAAVLAALATAPLAAHHGSPDDHAALRVAQAGAAAAADADMAQGEVRKVDRANGKLTLKHGEIRKLDMPPMTMVFRVRDAAMLDGLKAGDKVRFAAEKAGSAYTVTKIEAAR